MTTPSSCEISPQEPKFSLSGEQVLTRASDGALRLWDPKKAALSSETTKDFLLPRFHTKWPDRNGEQRFHYPLLGCLGNPRDGITGPRRQYLKSRIVNSWRFTGLG
ncbi:hypothetical protein KI688_003087 [Linnemannia hyalina]|uniref:Uncharacterized protein n=1 Tax=Linnemannia hyalina TaxID=64524 RepID=A0A9P8BTC6_9FUNG|nr:hypothetical protein KI688_003087 [Linnemannia hyalina]